MVNTSRRKRFLCIFAMTIVLVTAAFVWNNPVFADTSETENIAWQTEAYVNPIILMKKLKMSF